MSTNKKRINEWQAANSFIRCPFDDNRLTGVERYYLVIEIGPNITTDQEN
jgi:hypothetical protein